MNLDDFCSNEIPDFTPLGGNRPDCAVVMAVAVSLVDNRQHPQSQSLPLPPDVLDTAMAAVCATVIVRLASDVISPPCGSDRGGRLSCRLELASESFAVFWYSDEDEEDSDEDEEDDRTLQTKENTLPWRYYDKVTLKMVLPDSITSCGNRFLKECNRLAVVDLRHSMLQTMGDSCFESCSQLKKVYLPDTLQKVGRAFLHDCTNLVFVNLRDTKLRSVGEYFMIGCDNLTVDLPDTLERVGLGFLSQCNSLVSIDLSNTKLHTAGMSFLFACRRLTEVKLPDTLETVGSQFAYGCHSLVSIDLRNTKLHTVDSFLCDCRSLTEVHLPDTLKSISGAFLRHCDIPQKEIDRLEERFRK